MNDVKWSRKATKQLMKLHTQDQKKVYVAIGDLAMMPETSNVKTLKNHQYGYRLRVGNYPVLFDCDGAVKIVSIEEVRKRDERTY